MTLKMVILRETAQLPPGQVPDWIHVAPSGRIEIQDGNPLFLDASGGASAVTAFKALGHDMVVDYEHQTLSGKQAPAAGWVKDLEMRPDGLWARVEWTEAASGLIARREYRYHSPVLLHGKDRRVVELYNIALTNQPRMLNVAALAAKHVINPEQGAEDMKLFEQLKKLLGLADTASEDDAAKAVEALKADKDKLAGADKELAALKQTAALAEPLKLVACKEVLDSLGLDQTADKAKAVAAIEALKAPAAATGEMGKQLADLSRTVETMKAEGLMAEALKDGKVSPAELDNWGRKMAASDPEMFKLVVLSRKRGSIVPVDGMPPAGGESGSVTDDLQVSINKQMGVDDETYKKFGPKKEGK